MSPERSSDKAAGSLHGVAPLDTPDQQSSIILHVDCDAFYAACERRREPQLEDEPVVVGMGYEPGETHGAVATASYEARDYGIESAMPITTAVQKLPPMTAAGDDPAAPDSSAAGHYRSVDLEYYKQVGEEVQAQLQAHADVLEPVSIDEAYLDVTSRTNWDSVTSFAKELKAQIATDVGIPVSIGVAPTKSAAKAASDHDKPDGLVVVEPDAVQAFFAPLDVEAVHGIGPVTAGRLREIGIETAGDLATADPERLEAQFGSRGKTVHQRARGHDPRPVTPPDDPKSISKETSFQAPITERTQKRQTVRTLTDQVTDRAAEQGALYRTVQLKVIEPPYEVHTRAQTLSGPIGQPDVVERIALRLLEEFDTTPVRKLGVTVGGLTLTETDQATLQAWTASTTPSREQTTLERFRET